MQEEKAINSHRWSQDFRAEYPGSKANHEMPTITLDLTYHSCCIMMTNGGSEPTVYVRHGFTSSYIEPDLTNKKNIIYDISF